MEIFIFIDPRWRFATETTRTPLSSNRCSAFRSRAGCCFQFSRERRKIYNCIQCFRLFSCWLFYFRCRAFNATIIRKAWRFSKQKPTSKYFESVQTCDFNSECWACGDDVNTALVRECTLLTSRCLRKQLVVSLSQHFTFDGNKSKS